MSRFLILNVLLATSSLVWADGAGDSPSPAYPPPQDAAPAPVPYPYAQAQKDSYAADLAQYAPQQQQYEGVYYQPQAPVYPGFALAAAKTEVIALAAKAVSWVASKLAAAALGAALALAVCKLTPLCALLAHKWHRSEPVAEDVRSFVEPAVGMLRAALAKYGAKSA